MSANMNMLTDKTVMDNANLSANTLADMIFHRATIFSDRNFCQPTNQTDSAANKLASVNSTY